MYLKKMRIAKEEYNDGEGSNLVTSVANVRIEGRHSESVRIYRGVRQGCVLFLLLFNL